MCTKCKHSNTKEQICSYICPTFFVSITFAKYREAIGQKVRKHAKCIPEYDPSDEAVPLLGHLIGQEDVSHNLIGLLEGLLNLSH